MREAATPLLPGLLPLTRAANGEAPFLAGHHMLAAERFHRLFHKAQLRRRVTMHYGPSTGGGGRGADDIADMAADARKQLNAIHLSLPRDCAEALVDICGFEKGLQAVEMERGWPRRSAKIVLRIALDCLAAQFGLASAASGLERGSMRRWGDEGARPVEFY